MKKFIIKHESLAQFLADNQVKQPSKMLECSVGRRGEGVTGIQDNEIFLKKDCGLEISQTVEIQTKDWLVTSNRESIVNYNYVVQEHDDFSVKLELKSIHALVVINYEK